MVGALLAVRLGNAAICEGPHRKRDVWLELQMFMVRGRHTGTWHVTSGRSPGRLRGISTFQSVVNSFCSSGAVDALARHVSMGYTLNNLQHTIAHRKPITSGSTQVVAHAEVLRMGSRNCNGPPRGREAPHALQQPNRRSPANSASQRQQLIDAKVRLHTCDDIQCRPWPPLSAHHAPDAVSDGCVVRVSLSKKRS